ncbi:aminotransferase class III-fold pyridoxal phosphate-dependent enzyme [Paenibacillus amylolyticus]|nr:aminotransferase class III-fold pyridoxal phosphate-dependent enzyme [Paenibacillus amylolyticus]
MITEMMQYNQRVKQWLPGGVHYNFHLPWEETPLHFKHASRSRVTDMNDNEYLDLYARFGALIVGHSNEEYNECLKDTIDRVLSVSHCDLDAEALELIHQYVPSAEMIRFGLSGTEIVQNALRLAQAWTGKNRFVRFEGHYHGNADNIMGGKTARTGLPVPSDYPGDMKGTKGRGKGCHGISILPLAMERRTPSGGTISPSWRRHCSSNHGAGLCKWRRVMPAQVICKKSDSYVISTRSCSFLMRL